MDINELESFKMSDAVKFHSELNPKLWEDHKLDPEVRDQLLLIAKDFVEYLGLSDLKVKDVTISGSNAAYSYTPHSDLDLHILVDFNDLPNNEVYQELFTAKKTLYNDQHDISVHDVPVELYVQDINQPVQSLGEYSIVHDKWIRIPKKRRANYDEAATKLKYEKLGDLIELALKSKDAKKVADTIAIVKRYRKSGLDKHGEFGPENLAYKAVRKQGLVQQLYDLKAQLHGEKLSIEESDNKKTAVLKIQKHLNKKYNANLDLDGILGPLTLKSINKFMPKASKGLADEPNKTTRVQGKEIKKDYGYTSNEKELNEWLDAPYPYKKLPRTSRIKIEYEFTTKDGNLYDVAVAMHREDIAVVNFNMIKKNTGSGTEKLTGTGDSIKVMSTVINIVKDAITDWNYPKYIMFEASTSEPSRVKLYAAMGRMAAKALPNYTLQSTKQSKYGTIIKRPGGYSITTLVRTGPVNEAPRTFQSQSSPLEKLVQDYGYLTTFGMTHLDKQGATPEAQQQLLALVQRMSKDGKTFANLDKQKMEANRDTILNHIHQMMQYAIPILKKNLPADKWEAKRSQINKVLQAYNDARQLNEASVILSTDPDNFGATVDDTNLKKLPVVMLPLKKLVYFEPLSKMETPEAKRWVERLISKIEKGRKIKPILVREWENGYQVLDGHHRFHAYKLLNKPEIPAQIVPDDEIEIVSEASGYIPSAKEKNDPRFKTALTVDVKPDAIKKNAKAFGFKTSRAGIPPQARADGKIAESLMNEWKKFLAEDEEQQELFPGYDKEHREERLNKWLGKSHAMVGKKPQILYHATTKDFDQFRVQNQGWVSGDFFGNTQVDRTGIFLAQNPKFAEEFIKNNGTGPEWKENARIIPVYLSAQYPFSLLDDSLSPMLSDEATVEEFKEHDIDLWSIYRYFNEDKRWELFDGPEGEEFVNNLKKLGYDSAVMREEAHSHGGSEIVWVAFEPSQVKAIHNRGSFSPDDPRLTKENEENPGHRPIIGYHVTATKNLPVIRKKGINADRRGNSYVWDSPEMAEWFTDFQNDKGQDRTILKIDMSGIDARPDPEAEDMSEWSSRFKPGTNGGAWIVSGSIPPNKIIG
jgi:hypothetical protein